MKLYEKKVYECEFCGKISKSAGAMAQHERKCRKNPDNIPMCFTCEYYDEDYFKSDELKYIDYDIAYDYYDDDNVETIKFDYLQFCKHDGETRLYNARHVHNPYAKKTANYKGWKKCPSCTEGCPFYKEKVHLKASSHRFNFETMEF